MRIHVSYKSARVRVRECYSMASHIEITKHENYMLATILLELELECYSMGSHIEITKHEKYMLATRGIQLELGTTQHTSFCLS